MTGSKIVDSENCEVSLYVNNQQLRPYSHAECHAHALQLLRTMIDGKRIFKVVN